MVSKIITTVLRSIATYIILLILGRIIGRKLISRITFFDFIVGIALGSIGVRIALGSQESPLLAAISASIITLLVYFTDYADINSVKIRKIIDGEPIILISNGKMLNKNLKKAKVTTNKLMMLLREKNMFNIEDVALAAIENDGELSVLPAVNKQPITTGDLNITASFSGLMIDIIIDGKILLENLQSVNHDEQWVQIQLKHNNIYDIKQVFYAGLNSTDNLYISKKT